MDKTYALTELAREAGVSARTVRYYINEGLLPPPLTAGRKARYSEAHLERINLIRSLSANHLPLAEIRRGLEGGSTTFGYYSVAPSGTPELASTLEAVDYLQAVGNGPALKPMIPSLALAAPVEESAAGYARRALREQAPGTRQPGLSPLTPRTPPFFWRPNTPGLPGSPKPAFPPTLLRSSAIGGSAPDANASPVPDISNERSQWERISISADFELHVRRPLSRGGNRALARILAVANEICSEEGQR